MSRGGSTRAAELGAGARPGWEELNRELVWSPVEFAPSKEGFGRYIRAIHWTNRQSSQ